MYKKHFACRERQQHNDLGKDEVSFQNYRHVEKKKKKKMFERNLWKSRFDPQISLLTIHISFQLQVKC